MVSEREAEFATATSVEGRPRAIAPVTFLRNQIGTARKKFA